MNDGAIEHANASGPRRFHSCYFAIEAKLLSGEKCSRRLKLDSLTIRFLS
jgi:hypothetical protein